MKHLEQLKNLIQEQMKDLNPKQREKMQRLIDISEKPIDENNPFANLKEAMDVKAEIEKELTGK